MNYKSSSICRELLKNTKEKRIEWVSCAKFMDYLEIEGIAYDDIKWFHNYLKHTQLARHLINCNETYFSFYDDRIFAISKSRYSRDIRIDFNSSYTNKNTWVKIVDTKESILRLLSFVEIMNSVDSTDECNNLLYATGCIHA